MNRAKPYDIPKREVWEAYKCQFAPNVVPPFALNVSPSGGGVCSRPAA
jgi:hypothetical protein